MGETRIIREEIATQRGNPRFISPSLRIIAKKGSLAIPADVAIYMVAQFKEDISMLLGSVNGLRHSLRICDNVD